MIRDLYAKWRAARARRLALDEAIVRVLQDLGKAEAARREVLAELRRQRTEMATRMDPELAVPSQPPVLCGVLLADGRQCRMHLRRGRCVTHGNIGPRTCLCPACIS